MSIQPKLSRTFLLLLFLILIYLATNTLATMPVSASVTNAAPQVHNITTYDWYVSNSDNLAVTNYTFCSNEVTEDIILGVHVQDANSHSDLENVTLLVNDITNGTGSSLTEFGNNSKLLVVNQTLDSSSQIFIYNFSLNPIASTKTLQAQSNATDASNAKGSQTTPFSVIKSSCLAYSNDLSVTANTPINISANVTQIDLVTNENVTGRLIITEHSSNPVGSNSNVALDQYITIDVSGALLSSIINFTLNINYTASQVSAKNLQESSLALYSWQDGSWTLRNSSLNTLTDTLTFQFFYSNVTNETLRLGTFSLRGSAILGSSSSSSGGGGGGSSSSSSGGGGGSFAPCDDGYSRVEGRCIKDDVELEQNPGQQPQGDSVNRQEDNIQQHQEGDLQDNTPNKPIPPILDDIKTNLAGFAFIFDSQPIFPALVMLLILFFLLLLFFVWRRHKEPMLIVHCPKLVEQGQIMQVKVLLKNGGHDARITLGSFINQRLSSKLQDEAKPIRGSSNITLDLKSHKKEKRLISIPISKSFAVGTYTLITCAKVNWGIEERTIASRNDFTVIEPVHFRYRTSVEFRNLLGKLRERVPLSRTIPSDIAKKLYLQTKISSPVVDKLTQERDLELQDIEADHKSHIAAMRARILEIEQKIKSVVGDLEQQEEDLDIEYLKQYEDRRLSRVEKYYRSRREFLDKEPRKYLDKLLNERGQLVSKMKQKKKKK